MFGKAVFTEVMQWLLDTHSPLLVAHVLQAIYECYVFYR